VSIPATGTPAPDFTLQTDDGTSLTLSSLRGRPVVLYFYPKDDTPGCTKESCEFQELVPRFEKVNAQVLGISPDSVKSHAKFRDKYQLNFPLLADEGHTVADQYGVWQQKSMFGMKYWGNARTTFVIDAKGRIAHVFEKVKPAGHAAEVAEVVGKLK
jgi:peroxiredoxin Q/BCP